jgi:hypothetical protein
MQVEWTGADATALRGALGISQPEFARRTGVSLAAIKMWRNRGSFVRLSTEFASIMDTVLARATAEQVARFASMTGRNPGGDSPTHVAPAGWSAGSSGDCAAACSELTRKDLMLDRRQLTQALLGVAIGANLLEPMDHWLFFASGQGGAGVGLQEVGELENVARAFREWDDQFGGGLRRKAVVGQLSEVSDLVREFQPPAVQRRLLMVMAQLSETAAVMSWDSGQQAMAQQYFALAARVSSTAGDTAFCANALAGMARQMLCLDNPGDALELIRLAQDRAGREATPTVRAMLYTREAWAYGKMGRPSAFRRACVKARETFEDADRTLDPFWIEYFDAAELAGTIGGRLLELARNTPAFAGEAAQEITRALELRRPGRLRSSALDQLGLAEARLIEGEVEEACRVGHDALATVERTASDRVRVKALEVYHRAKPLAGVTAVAELRDRLRGLVTTTAEGTQ